MAEVAYLLGAGASAEAVPVVLAMGEEIEKAIKKLNSSINNFANETFSFDGRNISYREAHQLAISRLGPLQYECKRHSSVDTYAKKLYFKDKVKFNELKATFSFYLTLAQVYNEIPNKRYDNFWASVLQDNGDLPEKVKIISWNYDFQVEMSYQGMLNWNSLSDAKKYLNVLTPKRILDRFDPKKFGMIKLNGSAIISSNAQNNPLYLCELQNADQVQNNLIELLRAFYFLVHRIDEYKIELYFSWENPSFLQQSNLREFLKPIEVLVIIGYSFPFFNRKSDSKIFQYLQNLKKIYIQNPRAAEVLDEINQIYTPGAHGVNVELRTSHTQFLFPKELEV